MLKDLKIFLGIAESDESLDPKLNLLLSNARQRLKILLGGQDPPEELEYIITDVAVIRYNKIGSEGLSSHSVEGESSSFTDDDFAGYKSDIQAWLNAQEDAKRGKVRFI